MTILDAYNVNVASTALTTYCHTRASARKMARKERGGRSANEWSGGVARVSSVMPHRSRMMLLRGCYAPPSEQQRCPECPGGFADAEGYAGTLTIIAAKRLAGRTQT